jgi:outer membrane protein assembly factor BamB
VIGGAVGWALSIKSGTGTPQIGGTGSTSLQTPQPTFSGLFGTYMQQYYGEGPQRKATWSSPTGNSILATPGTGAGMVYVGSSDNNVYAITMSGKKAWSHPATSVTAPPQVVGDIVCVGTGDGKFYALRAGTGAQAWGLTTGVPAEYKPNFAVAGSNVILSQELEPLQAYDVATGVKGVTFSTTLTFIMTLAVADGVLYVLDSNGAMHAFRTATGAGIWQKQLLASSEQPTGLTISGGSIFLGTSAGAMYQVDGTNGNVVWTYHPGSDILSAPVVADGLVYVKDNNGTLHAVSIATHKPVWTQTGAPTSLYGMTVVGGRVYYTTSLAMQARDAKTGKAVWASAAPTGKAFMGTPAVANGMVFIGCSDDALYAIKA